MSELMLLVLVAMWCVGWIATADKILREGPGDLNWHWIIFVYILMSFIWFPLLLIHAHEVLKEALAGKIEVPERYRDE